MSGEQVSLKILFNDKNGLSVNHLSVNKAQLSPRKLTQEIGNLLCLDDRHVIEIRWFDGEEKVPLENDHDLDLALKCRRKSSNTLNLYVTTQHNQNGTVTKSIDDLVTHHSVLCDSCHSVIMGNRFNCLECYDFDLCNACFLDNAHNNSHSMIVIRRNVLNPVIHKMMINCHKELRYQSNQIQKSPLNLRHGRRYSDFSTLNPTFTDGLSYSPIKKMSFTNPFLDHIDDN